MATLPLITAVFRTGASGSLAPTVQPLVIPRGESIKQPFKVVDEAGAAVNLTNYAVVASIGPQNGPATISREATITGEVGGLGNFKLANTETNLSPVPLWWDLEIIGPTGPDADTSKIVLRSPVTPSGGVYTPGQSVQVLPSQEPLAQGPQGVTGATGATGPQGPAGADGANGPPGPSQLTQSTDSGRSSLSPVTGMPILNTSEGGAFQSWNGSQWVMADGARSLLDELLADAPFSFWKFSETSNVQTALDYSDGGLGAGVNTAHLGSRPSSTRRASIIPRTKNGSLFNQATITGNTVFAWGSAFTLEYWGQTTVGETLGPTRIISSSDLVFAVQMESDGSITINNQPAIAPAGTIVASARYHLAVTYDGATTKLYINGSLVGSQTGDVGPDPQALLASGSSEFRQYMVAYASALTANRIADHYIASTNQGLTPNVAP